MRRVALGVLVPLVGLLLACALFLGRLAQGPLDVTGLSHRWGHFLAHPAGGTLSWGRAAIAWQPGRQTHPSELLVQLDDVRFRPPAGGSAPVSGSPAGVEQSLAHAGIIFNLAALLRGEVMVRTLDVTGLRLSLMKDPQGRVQLAGLPFHAATPSSGGRLPIPELAMQIRHVGLHDVRLSMADSTRPAGVLAVQLPLLQADYRRQTGWRGQLVAVLSIPGEKPGESLPSAGKDGTGSAQTGAGGAPPAVRLTGSIGPAGGEDSHWQLSLSPVRPVLLAPWLPLPPSRLAFMRGGDLPLSLRLEGQLHGRGLVGQLDRMSGHLESGAGQLRRPGKAPLDLAGVSSSFAVVPVSSPVAPRQQALSMQARLLLKDTRGRVVPLSLNGRSLMDDLFHPRQMTLTLEGDAPAFDFATLGSIWPEGAARGARRWMTTNMTAGQGEGLRVEAHLHSNTGPDGLVVDRLAGDLTGHDLSVTWVQGLPQVTGIEAHARFLDADHLQIDVQHGRLPAGGRDSISLPTGRIILAGLMQKRQTGQFSLGMEGELPAFLSVLSQPRLNLLSRHPVGFSGAGGALKGTLSLALPLNIHVRMKEIDFGATFEARQVRLVLPSLGGVRQGWGHLAITDTGLTITGGAQLWGLAATGTFFDSFLPNRAGTLMMKADLQAPLGAGELRRLGAPPSMARAPLLHGQGKAHVLYSRYGLGNGHSRGTVLLQTDFTSMAFTASYWQKPAGVAAGLQASLGWEDGRFTRLEDVQAYGPALALQARARMRRGLVGGLALSHFRLGRTEGHAMLDWPLRDEGAAGGYRFDLQATTLDMTPWWGTTTSSLHVSRAGAANETAPAPLSPPVPLGQGQGHEQGQPGSRGAGEDAAGRVASASLVEGGHTPFLPAGRWAVSLHADKVIYGAEQHSGLVAAHARWADKVLEEAGLSIGQPDRVTFALSPVAGQAGALDVRLDIADAGALFASLGLYRQFSGGVLSLRGRCTPVGPDEGKGAAQDRTMGFGLGLPPFRGALKVDHMALDHPPAPLVMATLAAPLHWGQIPREKFENVRLRASLHMAGNRLDVVDGRASNEIFGGTLKGQMDFGRATLNMEGTLSPFFGLNHAAGTMFGEKTVMAPEKGSGVMAMTYTLAGSFAKPELHVNPFAALLPGALRNLFDWD